MKRDIDFSNQNVGMYRIGNKLGQGNWATVYEAFSLDGINKYAVKVTAQARLTSVPKLRQLVQSEINILKACDNPNVIKFKDQFKQNQNQFIVMQFCNGGELAEILRTKEAIIESEAIQNLKQILNGFKGLHQVKAIHRDFKVENVLLHDNICKIADLGFGKMLIEEDVTRTKLGSNLTMAPEVMEGKPYGIKADIWSVGVVFYQLLYGMFPFKAKTMYGILQKAKSGQIDFSYKNISNEAEDFIRKCLNYDPNNRINWSQIYEHPLITDKKRQLFMAVVKSKININANANFYKQSQIDWNKSFRANSTIKEESFQYQSESQMMSKIKIKSQIILDQFQVQKQQKIDLDQNQSDLKQPQIQQQIPIIHPHSTIQGPKFNLIQFQQNRCRQQQRLKQFLKMENRYITQLRNHMYLPLHLLYHCQNIADKIHNIHQLYIYLIFKDAYIYLSNIMQFINNQFDIFELGNYFNIFIKNKKYDLAELYQQKLTKLEEVMMTCRHYLQHQQFDESVMTELFDNTTKNNQWTTIVKEQLNNFWIQLGEQLDQKNKNMNNFQKDIISVVFAIRNYLNFYDRFEYVRLQNILLNFDLERGKADIIAVIKQIHKLQLQNSNIQHQQNKNEKDHCKNKPSKSNRKKDIYIENQTKQPICKETYKYQYLPKDNGQIKIRSSYRFYRISHYIWNFSNKFLKPRPHFDFI